MANEGDEWRVFNVKSGFIRNALLWLSPGFLLLAYAINF
jgi:hypothetical protein